MKDAFDEMVGQLPTYLERLLECTPVNGASALPSDLPSRGVYLFSEANRHLYVGRTNRLRTRLREHLKGKSNDAPFAFKIARHMSGNPRTKGGLTRKALEADPAFAKAFAHAKSQVSMMEWRWVAIDEPNLQCLFEIYAAIVLRAEFNDFENH
jgi:hypothetical protein